MLTTLKEQYISGKIQKTSSLNHLLMHLNKQFEKSADEESDSCYIDISLELYGVFLFLKKIIPHMDPIASFRYIT